MNYKKMTANDIKPFLRYLNKLIDKYYAIFHRSVSKKPIDADHSARQILYLNTNFKVGDRIRTTMYKNIFSKGYTKNRLREIFIIGSLVLC